jgi:hypothetical protein
VSQDKDDFPKGSDSGNEVPSAGVESTEDREMSFSRRALLHAGWTVPVIMTVAPPRVFAQSPGGNHTDGVTHNDAVTHTDGVTHNDG